jgi:hypothetical protein
MHFTQFIYFLDHLPISSAHSSITWHVVRLVCGNTVGLPGFHWFSYRLLLGAHMAAETAKKYNFLSDFNKDEMAV